MRMVFRFAVAVSMSTIGWCGLIVTADSPDVQQTTVAGAVTNTFDSLPLGYQTNVTFNFGGVTGTYDVLYIAAANIFGGSYASQYPVANNDTNTETYSLTLSAPVNYFGMFWSAGDDSNLVQFYLGATQVASYTLATAMGSLPASYYGNPNDRTEDPTEPFAFLNFYGTSGTTFDRIVLSVTRTGAGFESDNHAIAMDAGAGSVTPEPYSIALVVTGLAALVLLRKRSISRGR